MYPSISMWLFLALMIIIMSYLFINLIFFYYYYYSLVKGFNIVVFNLHYSLAKKIFFNNGTCIKLQYL